MTREEAVGVIKSECYVFNPLNLDRSTRINTALDMAIKALEQELRWIPVSDRLPAIKQHVLLSCYGRVIYGRMMSEDGNSSYPVFEICDSVGEKSPIVFETTAHSEYTTSRIKAWMQLPEPYNAEMESEE